MKIYVTGATGFIGSHLIPSLLDKKHDITCLVRSPENISGNPIYEKCTLVKGDITNRNSLKKTIENIDVVIHLAVLATLDAKKQNVDTFYTVNAQGTKNILEECLASKPKRILCFSSTAAIGIPKADLIDESTALRPLTPYGQSKAETEKIILNFTEKYNLPIITLCFPHVYGPGEKRDFLKITRMIKKGIFPQIGFSPNLYPAIYVSDAVDAICLAIDKGKAGEKYIIADGDPHDLRVARKLVLKNLGIKRRFYPVVPKYISILFMYVIQTIFGILRIDLPIKAKNLRSIAAGRRLSIDKAKKDIGFNPKVSFEKGIRHTIEWYVKERLI